MSIAKQIPNNREKILIQVLVLSVGIFLMSLKFFAFFKTNSNAILTDALESIINVVAGSFGMYSLYLASKPHDEDHPYGHGKIEFISATIEGGLIAAAGGLMIVKSIYNFFVPSSIGHLDVGLVLVFFAGMVNYIIGHIAVKNGEKNSSLTLIASGEHLKSDAYSSIGLIVGLGFILLSDLPWLDNVVAILMGVLIIFSGYKILKKSVAGIMDEADFALLEKVVFHLNENRRDNWIDTHNMRIINLVKKFI